MKIKTLIKRLSDLDPEMQVLINDDDDEPNILDACISLQVIDLEADNYLVKANPFCCEGHCKGKAVLIN